MNAVRWSRRRAAGQAPRRSVLQQLLTATAVLLGAAASQAAIDERSLRITPPRLALVEGEVSFWRPGSGEWEAAQVNVPLAPGDALATQDGRLEVQIGPNAYLRADANTQLRVQSQEPDFLQVEVTAGRATFDIREMKPGSVLQVVTPNSTMTISRDGYYRVDAEAGTTSVVVRRAGVARLAPAGGNPVDVATGESVLIEGSNGGGKVNVGAAPGFDEWDRWCYDRADGLLAAPRSYAVSEDIYGAEELERHGTWRYTTSYGRVWAPTAVPAGWAPYTYGRWINDPYYGYSWVDYAPWGWAPYHYGRWVWAGYWGWAPGPVVVSPFYAPALVAFFGGPYVSVGIGVPFVSWVALGWGEPFIPWWGGWGFRGNPCWYGWGGPRIVNNIIINNGDTINAGSLREYRNMRAPGGINGVEKGRFTQADLQRARLTDVRAENLKPIAGKPPVDTADFDAARGGNVGKAPPRDYAGAGSKGGPSRAAVDAAANFSREARASGAGVPSRDASTARLDAYESRRGGNATSGASAGAPRSLSRSTDAQRGAAGSPPDKGTNRYQSVRERGGAAAAGGGQPRSIDRAGQGGGTQSPPPLPNKGSTASQRRYESVRGGGGGAPAAKQPRGAQSGNQLRRAQSPPPLPAKSGRSARSYYSSSAGRAETGSVSRYQRTARNTEAGAAESPSYKAPARPARSGSVETSKAEPSDGGRSGGVSGYGSAPRRAPAPDVGGSTYGRNVERGGSMPSRGSLGGGSLGGGSFGGGSFGGGGMKMGGGSLGGRSYSGGGGGGGGAPRNLSR